MSLPNVWKDLKERGFIADMSDTEALQKASVEPLTVYAGFDATASSFHAGHLLLFMLLNHLQRAGHTVIALIGGGTTQVGDPSDKKSERPMIEKQTIARNIEKLCQTFEKLLQSGSLKVVNNAEWLENIGYLDFLKNVGRHFSVNRMLTFDFIKNRLEANLPLSFLEMGYMLLQSYDFLELFRRYNCSIQIGGQDQWANIISGVDLVRRMEKKQVFAVTCPLITTSSGAKMGKSASGAVWLDSHLLSPYDFWQFWRNTSDDDVARFLKLFTFLPLTEIASLTAESGQALNQAKIRLADEITRFVHGQQGLDAAHRETSAAFAGADGEASVTCVEASAESLVDLVLASRLVSSKSEARRSIRAGSVRIDGTVIEDENACVKPFVQNKVVKVSVGKKKHVFLKKKA